MEELLKSIENSLENKNWYSALVVSLIIPDICGKVENNTKSSSKRYSEWFDKYLGEKYNHFLSGDDCYAFRCSFLHEGSSEITKQNARKVLDRFVFISNGTHCNMISDCYFNDPKYDGKKILQLSVLKFCQDIINATRQWIEDTPKNKSEIIKIKEEILMGSLLVK